MTRAAHLLLAGLSLLGALTVGLATGIGIDPEAFFRGLGLSPSPEPLRAGRHDAPFAATAAERAPPWLEAAVCDRSDLPEAACSVLALAIHEESRQAQLDPLLVLAVIEVESSWDVRAISGRGACGLMQLRRLAFESEARRAFFAGADRLEPVDNVRAGIRYLGRLRRSFRDPDLALIAFNAGPTRVRAHLREEGQVPERLRTYPRRVRRTERALRKALALEAAGF
ncbi:MAG TPA: transglycosylase SLT domain-containing protein [Anaeromyxobacteraceae bacterium]|nr:transglycosylase SLT domain-containing protein [Anaeromyxobacteraceae bacterium]